MYSTESFGRLRIGYLLPTSELRQTHNKRTYTRRRVLGSEWTTPFIHRRWLPSRIETEEKRRALLGPVHRVATRARVIRISQLFLFVGTVLWVSSKISGGSVTSTFGSGGSNAGTTTVH
jgi:hypothetical protein